MSLILQGDDICQQDSSPKALNGDHLKGLQRRLEVHLGGLTADSAALEEEKEDLKAQLKNVEADRWKS